MFKKAGFNAIRVPVTWYPHMGTVTVTRYQDAEGNWKGRWDMSTWNGYDVDPAWMARVKEVVGYVLDEGMYCILNVHHDTGASTTGWLRADRQVYDSVKERYCSLWNQIATEFESYGQRLVFESFNEMLDANSTWNSSTAEAHEVINMYNADFVATVRATGGRNAYRNLILNTYAASSTKEAITAFRLPEDTVEGHLMAEVHSYAPYHFAFDTATPKEVFDDACDNEVRGIVEGLNTYLVSKGIPCVLGEFGADTGKRRESELAKQAACYVSAAAKYNIACFYWMGLSDGDDRKVPKWTKPTLKDAVIKAYKENKN
jgi:endoglucanase